MSDFIRVHKRLDDVVTSVKELSALIESSAREYERDRSLLREEVRRMAGEIDRLSTEVSETKTVMEGASAALANLAQMIRDRINEPERLSALADDLDASTAKLAKAIKDNTFADGEPNGSGPIDAPQIPNDNTPPPVQEPAPGDEGNTPTGDDGSTPTGSEG